MVEVEPPPPPGVKPSDTYAQLGANLYWITDTYGDITINLELNPEEQQMTLDHEKVHAFLSPKFGPFRQVRARLAMSGYSRSALLRYIEEAMAETYAQVRANGIRSVITGIKFPLENGYITVQEANMVQGVFLGVVSVEGHLMRVTLTVDPQDGDHSTK